MTIVQQKLFKHFIIFNRRLINVRLHFALCIICCFAFVRIISNSLFEIIYDEKTVEFELSADKCVFNFVDKSDFVPHTNTKLEQDLVNGTSLCPNTRRPKFSNQQKKSWQYQKARNSSIIVYSAFYDDRPAVGVTPWIRIQGVASLADWNSTLYCHVWFKECHLPFVIEAQYIITGRKKGYILNGRKFLQLQFSCPLPGAEPFPSHVSLVESAKCNKSTIHLPVERAVRAQPDHEFGVCVAISFGSIPIPEFVEWIELNRIFGITEFNIYDAGMNNMSSVFDYYTSQGILRIHHMPPPVSVKEARAFPPSRLPSSKLSGSKLDSIKLNSPASLNDCMLRNVYRYRYLAVIDFDETIVPRIHANYSHMMQHIHQKYRSHSVLTSYLFRNVYFFLNFRPDTSQPLYLRTARFRRRVDVSNFKMAPKSFVDPRICLSLFNHYCYIPLVPPMTNQSTLLLDVDPGIATSHHYRKCGFTSTKCNTLFQEEKLDSFALTFKARLQTNVKRVLRELNYEISD